MKAKDSMVKIKQSQYIVFVQPAFPHYRKSFFCELLNYPKLEFILYFSPKIEDTSKRTERPPEFARPIGQICTMPFGLGWQVGALGVQLGTNDVFVMSGNPRTLSNLALAFKARLRGARIIWWGHYWSATSKPWRFTLRLWMMRMADALMFYTEQEVAEYKKHVGQHDLRPIAALNNGIDCTPIRFTRRLPYLTADRPRDLLFIGRVTLKSNLELAIEALSQRCCHNVTLDVIGDGADVEKLRAYARDLGVESRIAWHGASTDAEFIGSVANNCKAFIYPGAVGLSLIHGLAYGLPAIVHDDRWKHMPEIAAHRPHVNGLTFRRNDAKALSETINSVLNSPSLLERMSKEAVETVEKDFNTKNMAKRFVSLVQDLNASG